MEWLQDNEEENEENDEIAVVDARTEKYIG